ncbi:hypothetical protein Pcinc_041348 [Petrolisthes cinctipes]|uniref:Uncharacterized protein n=1 Tax=Petrolisthes cinctipes TaxID=88211 RepID=A0AAE1BKZ6_PETCI|nr:hypothetical protein Pcinc_041348 [Petrolisthes cinctipes]
MWKLAECSILEIAGRKMETMKDRYKSQMDAFQEQQHKLSDQLEKLNHKTAKEMKNMMLWYIPQPVDDNRSENTKIIEDEEE